MPLAEEEPPASPAEAIAPPVTEAASVNFRNRTAVRIGLLAAAIASLLISLPMPMYINLVWMVVCLAGSGFFAAYLYRRRTGRDLPTRAGARIGWITGVFCFAFAMVFFTITVIAISMRGGLAEFYREQLSSQASGGVDLEEMFRVLESPSGLAVILFLSLLLLFLFSTLLPTLGGAMGAKVLEKE